MKRSFKIGNKEYKFKKDAIAHYRKILNSYDFGQSLNDDDFNDIIDLLNYDYLKQETSEICNEQELGDEISETEMNYSTENNNDDLLIEAF